MICEEEKDFGRNKQRIDCEEKYFGRNKQNLIARKKTLEETKKKLIVRKKTCKPFFFVVVVVIKVYITFEKDHLQMQQPNVMNVKVDFGYNRTL